MIPQKETLNVSSYACGGIVLKQWYIMVMKNLSLSSIWEISSVEGLKEKFQDKFGINLPHLYSTNYCDRYSEDLHLIIIMFSKCNILGLC